MKLTKLALIVVIPALVLALMGQSVRTPKAEARVTDIVTINPVLCLGLTASLDWNGDEVVNGLDTPLALSNCQSLDDSTGGSMANLVIALGGDPDNPQPSDFASIDMDGGQMHQLDGTLFFLAFVSNDEPVGFYADVGIFPASASSTFFCGVGGDDDCDDDGSKGDGVAVAKLTPGAGLSDGDRGPAEMRIRQGMLEEAEPYTIVGEPHDITVKLYKDAIQVGVPVCNLFSDTKTFLDALGSPETTPALYSVLDDDGTAVTGAWVETTISNSDGAMAALPIAPTLDLSASLGSNGAPNIICGLDEAGDITLTAAIVKGPTGVELDPQARERDEEVAVTVHEAPTTITMSANPASLTCDGTATSTVSAALADGDGNAALDGNRVSFSVAALGTVNPLESKSAGGAATTTLTPLSDILRGVTVDAILKVPDFFTDFDDLTDADIDACAAGTQTSPCPVNVKILVPVDEKTFLVECTAPAAPPPVAPPAGAPPTTILPPTTGDGGYLE